MTPQNVVGVDFSGAKLAGRNTWLARCEADRGRLKLLSLHSLETSSGTAERESALAWLVNSIATSKQTLWGIDFPFGLPVELFPAATPWVEQLNWLRSFGDDAVTCGRECVARALKLGESMHIRRITDNETKTPFDCYHYRIIHQTFHGMRRVLDPLLTTTGTAIVPFHNVTSKTSRVVVETCPSSTLKRLGLPSRNYKQPQGGPLTPLRLKTRKVIINALAEWIDFSDADRRIMTRNPGGDALDAVIATVGTWQAWMATDPKSITRHSRYRFEGKIFA